MNQVVVESMQWNSLRHIVDVRPIDNSDGACLDDFRRILIKHGQVGRFGVTLLHFNFDLDDDEILLETTDLERRAHYVRPVKKSFLAANDISAQTTVVGFDQKGPSSNLWL